MVATARSSTIWASAWAWAEGSWAVSAVMSSGARAQAMTLVAPSTTAEMVSTAEMDSKASSSLRRARWSMKTGMKVADRIPPSTTS